MLKSQSCQSWRRQWRPSRGQALYNTNGFNDVLARVVNNGTRYYSLAYSPNNPTMDGKFRHIQVKLLKGKDTPTAADTTPTS